MVVVIIHFSFRLAALSLVEQRKADAEVDAGDGERWQGGGKLLVLGIIIIVSCTVYMI